MPPTPEAALDRIETFDVSPQRGFLPAHDPLGLISVDF
jgi:hypothetical protein